MATPLAGALEALQVGSFCFRWKTSAAGCFGNSIVPNSHPIRDEDANFAPGPTLRPRGRGAHRLLSPPGMKYPAPPLLTSLFLMIASPTVFASTQTATVTDPCAEDPGAADFDLILSTVEECLVNAAGPPDCDSC